MTSRQKIILVSLAVFFTLLSLLPTFFEISTRKQLPFQRYFTSEHNYLFDYNFYLSRIRQGMEGRFLVTEKYYNLPHPPSLFQIVYLAFGKLGGILGLTPSTVYLFARGIFGFLLLLGIIHFGRRFFEGEKLVLFFLLAATAGSWPILVKAGPDPIGAGGFYRFATYMGWWSVIDSLQRITIMPHILIGQLFLIAFILKFADRKAMSFRSLLIWAVWGNLAGIIFPPTLLIVFAYFAVISALEFLDLSSSRQKWPEKASSIKLFLKNTFSARLLFAFSTIPSFLYMSRMFKIMPWKALVLFDIEHRTGIPYREYLMALGPVFVLGFIGLVVSLILGARKYYPAVAWITSIILLFLVFEKVPEQSPLRFTEGLIQVPLTLMSVYLLSEIGRSAFKKIILISGYAIVAMGFLVMISMVLWLTDQAVAKRYGTWKVPIRAELAYPLKDFMEAIFYLRDNTEREQVVLSFVTAGNYIPPYAGNYVFIGHANTPDEDGKEVEVARFFKGEFEEREAEEFMEKERISFVFYGPQEKAFGEIADLSKTYAFLEKVYGNAEIIIYRVNSASLKTFR